MTGVPYDHWCESVSIGTKDSIVRIGENAREFLKALNYNQNIHTFVFVSNHKRPFKKLQY
jgi:hypothetical protein